MERSKKLCNEDEQQKTKIEKSPDNDNQELTIIKGKNKVIEDNTEDGGVSKYDSSDMMINDETDPLVQTKWAKVNWTNIWPTFSN